MGPESKHILLPEPALLRIRLSSGCVSTSSYAYRPPRPLGFTGHGCLSSTGLLQEGRQSKMSLGAHPCEALALSMSSWSSAISQNPSAHSTLCVTQRIKSLFSYLRLIGSV